MGSNDNSTGCPTHTVRVCNLLPNGPYFKTWEYQVPTPKETPLFSSGRATRLSSRGQPDINRLPRSPYSQNNNRKSLHASAWCNSALGSTSRMVLLVPRDTPCLLRSLYNEFHTLFRFGLCHHAVLLGSISFPSPSIQLLPLRLSLLLFPCGSDSSLLSFRLLRPPYSFHLRLSSTWLSLCLDSSRLTHLNSALSFSH